MITPSDPNPDPLAPSRRDVPTMTAAPDESGTADHGTVDYGPYDD